MFGEMSLEEEIQGKMVLGHTMFPNVNGAVALYNMAGNP
jgi:hypothetical protein